MTIEQALYGPGWKLCIRCGVTQDPKGLEPAHLRAFATDAPSNVLQQLKPDDLSCKDHQTCRRWGGK